jgi:hypothetical protein
MSVVGGGRDLPSRLSLSRTARDRQRGRRRAGRSAGVGFHTASSTTLSGKQNMDASTIVLSVTVVVLLGTVVLAIAVF